MRSPGRVNLIGDLTGDTKGFVLSAAIDKEIICAISANYSDTCQVHAYNLRDTESFNVTKFKKSDKRWMNLVLGVVEQFQKRKLEVKGFDCVFGGDIPIGAGLASSAAISCAFAHGLSLLFEHGLSRPEVVNIARSAIKDYESIDSGIMDQFASVFGKANQVFTLNGITMEHEYFNFPFQEYRLILCDTGVKNADTITAQADRRQEIETGTALLKKHLKSIQSLRDVSLDLLSKHEAEFDPVIYRRCRIVLEENSRVLDCCEMLKKDDMPGFGQNMYKSHDSLRVDYEMSCKKLDYLKEKVQTSGMAIGSRMMVKGFGGSAINIVQVEKVDAFIKFVEEVYSAEYGRQLKTYPLKIANGTGKI
ncbi:MAG: galactokinase [Cyclobacteriaceae bacterium]|nr:galactokinase [Cyclobacteriaceae bacterium]